MNDKIIKKKIPNALFGTSFRYSSNKGEISLVNLLQDNHPNGLHTLAIELYQEAPYEIYCIKGNLFDDIERFSTLEKAELKINELLS